MADKAFWLTQIYEEWSSFPLGEVMEEEEVEDVQEGDEVLGELSDSSRKLFTILSRQTKLVSMQDAKEMDEPGDEWSPVFMELRAKFEAMRALFFACVRDELNAFGGDGKIVLRKGWKLVRSLKDGKPSHITISTTIIRGVPLFMDTGDMSELLDMLRGIGKPR